MALFSLTMFKNACFLGRPVLPGPPDSLSRLLLALCSSCSWFTIVPLSSSFSLEEEDLRSPTLLLWSLNQYLWNSGSCASNSSWLLIRKGVASTIVSFFSFNSVLWEDRRYTHFSTFIYIGYSLAKSVGSIRATSLFYLNECCHTFGQTVVTHILRNWHLWLPLSQK